MSRRQLVLLLDGTGNTLTGGKGDTNVLKTCELLAARNDDKQVLYYSSGVGASSRVVPNGLIGNVLGVWRRLPGLALGDGVIQNILNAYCFVAENYREGDALFVFGFSRGAFAALCVSEVISQFGLVRPGQTHMAEGLLALYFTPVRKDAVDQRTRVLDQVRRSLASRHGTGVRIRFLGLWDTVVSVGIPYISYLDLPSGPSMDRLNVQHVRQALALHEYRAPYAAQPFPEEDFGSAHAERSLCQHWFRGAHSDVGGGYPASESGLADNALRWMLTEACACGLDCEIPLPNQQSSCVQHDETYVHALWAFAGLRTRYDSVKSKAVGETTVRSPGEESGKVRSVWQRWRSPAPFILIGLGYGYLNRSLSQTVDVRGLINAFSLTGSVPALELKVAAVLHPQRFWSTLTDTPPTGVGVALLASGLVVLVVAYLLARVATWGFARLASVQPKSWPLRILARIGVALPFAIVAELLASCALTAANGVALHAPERDLLGPVLIWAGGLLSLLSYAGIAGIACLCFVAMLVARAQQRRHSVLQP